MTFQKGNTYWKIAAWHKKPFYATPEDLEKSILEYFEHETTRGKCKPTVSGLCYYLGFSHRQSLTYYMQKNTAFCDIIMKARKFIESCYESEIYQGNSVATFALSNMDREAWRHRSETDITTKELEVKEQPFDLEELSNEELALFEKMLQKRDTKRLES
ncbi:MAG TPA: terminase small subunit [Cytophagaceae bacterium]